MEVQLVLALLGLLLLVKGRQQEYGLRIRNLINNLILRRNQKLWSLLVLQGRFRIARRQRRRRAWPRPRNYLEELLLNREMDHQWKEHFRVNRETFRFLCQTLSNDIQRQDTQFRSAVPVRKCVAMSHCTLGLGTSECYYSVGLNFGLGKATAKFITNDVVNALVTRYNDFIKFPET